LNSVFLLRLAFDFTAASLLLIGLAYWWLGNAAHELAGTAMFVLLIVHNVFNRRWYGTVAKTRREPRSVINVGVTFLLLAGMLALLVTSVLISNTLSGIIPAYGVFTARQIHIFAGYWVLVIVAIHLGLRWPLLMSVARTLFGITRSSAPRTWVLRFAAIAIAVHGVWSSYALGIGSKLAMQMTLDWWNFEDSVAGFFVHCIAIAGLYIFLTYYIMKWLQQRKSRTPAVAVAALSLFFAVSSAETNAQTQAVGSKGGHLAADNRLRDLLQHPAFEGFGRLILPWDNRTYDEDMPLSNLGSLLPYHTQVRPDVVVGSLNRMIDDANNGKPVFYDFYGSAQKQEQAARENTGLFFYRGKPGAPFAIISPGGGFSYVGSVHEGFPYAVEISERGYNAFVLKYRAGQGGAVATQDLAAAISYVFRNAESLGVSTDSYSLWGSSAGARMAAAIGSHGVAAFGGDNLPKPSTVVMAYTAHSDFSPKEPPTFAVVGENDGIAPPSAMERRVAALRNAGTDVELRRYRNIGHGFGTGAGTSAEGWIADASQFWEKSMRPRPSR
jgi:acetyl esterase/lipase